MKVVKNKWIRLILFFIGCISLILGIIGIFLPLLPTTPFLILTAWCFLRCSPKAYAWLHSQSYLSEPLNNWNERGAISTPAKITAISLIGISLLIIWLKTSIFWIQVSLTCLLFSVSIFILTRPK
jgi:uncharacterized membrane protein YbaN (DUF454 family)